MSSIKSMIGHTMPAAGIAGLIKAILAVHLKGAAASAAIARAAGYR